MRINSFALVTCAACLLAAGIGSTIRGDDAVSSPAAGTGIRQVTSKHLTLYTDLGTDDEIDALGDYFDQAFAQWCAYFGVDEREHADWHVQCCLMKAPSRFRAAGLLSEDLPEFATGYTREQRIWLHEQTGEYYRRHLLLHEGTHAFMYSLSAGRSAPWYFEGVAELLATHRVADGRLVLNSFPSARNQVPRWGRIEMVQAACAAHQAMSLGKIFAYDSRAHFENEAYGWCWAAAAFLDGHPRYQARFRQLRVPADQQASGQHMRTLFAADWHRVNEDWQLYLANLDYGYDFRRMDFEPVVGKPLDADGASVSVAADRGWQSSGVRVEAGQQYRLRASGRYQIANDGRSWECEPNGVTIRYYRGRPLGILLAAVRRDEADSQDPSGLTKPIIVGLGATLTVEQSGTLYFRVNDSAGRLSDNAGTLSVEIKPR
ncbi:MAG TPA: hypothetical protein VGX76_16015 [Pirellulales bacterium]|nr:hypothetical protein [Pirellulales bacterium]